MLRTRIAISCLLTSLFLALTLPVGAADKASDEQTLRNATVLHAMLDSKDVPASVVAKADCVIVLARREEVCLRRWRNRWPRPDDLPR